MNFDGNFRRVGSANVELARAFVDKLSEESWRQDSNDARGPSLGAELQVIYLVHDDRLRHDEPLKRPALEVFGKAIRPILAVTADFFDSSQKGRELTEKNGAGYFVRAKLIRLMDGVTSAVAEDVVFSETHAHRLHVPIVSNPNISFKVGEETLSIPDGEIYEINNRHKRLIKNVSDSACVHLVLDYVLRGEMCCCAMRQHPDEPCSSQACFATDRASNSCKCFIGDDH
jgi:hypothetical protein